MKALVLLIFASSVLGSLSGLFVETSFTVKPETRLVGSEKTFAALFPYQVSIKSWTDDFLFKMTYRRCGGCILSANWVLTAAQCVYNRTAQIFIGSTLQFKIPKSKILVHLGYDGSFAKHDIALLRTPTITLSSYVKPITLSSQPIGFVNYNVTVAERDRRGVVFMKTTSDEECERIFPKFNEYNICAKPSGNGTVCHGDSGSPLVNSENAASVLIGIVSGGDRNCSSASPAIFIRVSSYMDWIIQLIA